MVKQQFLPVTNSLFLVFAFLLAFANWIMVPRSINKSKFDSLFLIKNCSKLKGTKPDAIDYEGVIFGDGLYTSDVGDVAQRSFVGEFLCVAYVGCLTKPTLLPDCNRTTD